MNFSLILGLAAAGLILLLMIGFILAYNRLQRLSVKVNEAASGIDVALEKRWDLLNELLSAVKKYLSHEYETLTGVAALRSGTETEIQRLKQQADVSAETLHSIDQEIDLQNQNMEKIRSQLDAQHGRGSSFRSRWEARSQNSRPVPDSQRQLRQADQNRNLAVSQKIDALTSLHRDLNSVTAGINAL